MSLELTNVSLKRDQQILIPSLSLRVQPGEIFTLMGSSGCGKSSLLSFIAGTLAQAFTAEGDIQLNQRSLLGEPVEKRQIGILFQDPLLFPHMTVLQNLMFASSSKDSRSKKQSALEALDEIGLNACANDYPRQLSGGQAARVSLVRTLAANPKAILLDEPFSKLDRDTRQQFRAQVYETITQRQIPAVLVSHDEDDIANQSLVLKLASPGQGQSC